ncbi:PIN domain-containing protein [Thiothrix eikelboomii]|uniref:PIN domain-containing protein n=1 Tax=Thiothrix eikelboomii TaxID=92487 RepID=UPI003BB1BEBD
MIYQAGTHGFSVAAKTDSVANCIVSMQIYMRSPWTWGELVFGAERSANPAKNQADIEGLAARLEILDFDDLAAAHFGQVRAELYAVGQPIGPYDMMIAGHARSTGLILVTNNLREFERVQGLRLENWAESISST